MPKEQSEPSKADKVSGKNTVESLIKEQKALYKEIEVYYSNYTKTSKTRHSKGYLLARIDGVKEPWSKYCKNNIKILTSLSEEESNELNYVKNDEFQKVEEMYTNFVGEVMDALEIITNSVSNENKSAVPENPPSSSKLPQILNQSFSALHDAQLPRIVLPKFSGSYDNWRSFYDLFKSVIDDNSSLSKVQKLHYLKTSLEGEAEKLIRRLNITEENYEPALQILVNRYDNKRVLVDTHLRILTSQPVIKFENADGLRKLLDTTNESIHTLRNFGLEVDSWDAIIIFLLIQKLPTKTQLAWDQSQNNASTLPKLKTFIEFLEGRFRSLERLQYTLSSAKLNESKSHSVGKLSHKKEVRTYMVSQGSQCPLCSKNHPLRQCSQFIKMNPVARLEFISKRSFCANCLTAYSHQTRGCSSPKSCYHCGKRHHSLLHNGSPHTSSPMTNPPSGAGSSYEKTASAEEPNSDSGNPVVT